MPDILKVNTIDDEEIERIRSSIVEAVERFEKSIESYNDKISQAQEGKNNAETDREKLIYEKLEERLVNEQKMEEFELNWKKQDLEKLKDPIIEETSRVWQVYYIIPKIYREYEKRIKNMTFEDIYNRIVEEMEEAKNLYENSNLKSFVLKKLNEILNGRRLACIRAIGIGSLIRYGKYNRTKSALQLAFALSIKQHYSEAVVTYQELHMHEAEVKWLTENGITVLPPDELLAIPNECMFEEDDDAVTMCFLPFVYWGLRNNLLKTYWTMEKMKNFILVANEFRNEHHRGMLKNWYWEALAEVEKFPEAERCPTCGSYNFTENHDKPCCIHDALPSMYSLPSMYVTWLKPDVKELPEIVEFNEKILILG